MNLTPSEILLTVVTFRVKVTTKWGEVVSVTGDTAALGKWSINQSVTMATDSERYPWWEVTVAIPSGLPCEYKYIIRAGAALRRYENLIGNRSITPVGVSMAVEDVFGDLNGSALSNPTRFSGDQTPPIVAQRRQIHMSLPHSGPPLPSFAKESGAPGSEPTVGGLPSVEGQALAAAAGSNAAATTTKGFTDPPPMPTLMAPQVAHGNGNGNGVNAVNGAVKSGSVVNGAGTGTGTGTALRRPSPPGSVHSFGGGSSVGGDVANLNEVMEKPQTKPEPNISWVNEGWLINEWQLRIRLGEIGNPTVPGVVLFRDHYTPFRVSMTPFSTGTNHPRIDEAYIITGPSEEDLSFTITLYDDSGAGGMVPLGRVCVLARELNARRGVLKRAILGSNLQVIGELTCNFLVIAPFVHENNNLKMLYKMWDEVVGVDIGHRGAGALSARSKITENTILSFLTASKQGVRYVEFDVQLTKDKIPVLAHDYQVHVRRGGNSKGERRNHGVTWKTPVSSLTWAEISQLNPVTPNVSTEVIERIYLQQKMKRSSSTGSLRRLEQNSEHLKEELKRERRSRARALNGNRSNGTMSPRSSGSSSTVESTSKLNGTLSANSSTNGGVQAVPGGRRLSSVAEVNGKKEAGGAGSDDDDAEVEAEMNAHRFFLSDGFASLEQALKKIPAEVGFDVEIKYPLEVQEETDYNFPERNEVIDATLQVCFDHAGSRRIFFSSFDPDICILLVSKQPRWPVFFLTHGGTETRYSDPRCRSLDSAIAFASRQRLRGVVSHASPVLGDLSWVGRARQAGLLLMTYGAPNNERENVLKQKQAGVHGIIADNVADVPRPHLSKTSLPQSL